MTTDLDTLLDDALQYLPAPRPVKAPVGPAFPPRTQHHSPIEAESRFVRFAAWWDELMCAKCGHADRTFDGLFEEREWIRPEEHPASGPQHWLKSIDAPLPELLKGAVSYVRYHRLDFCAKCIGAEGWPLAGEYRNGRHEPQKVQG